jgi:hypothetical protein
MQDRADGELPCSRRGMYYISAIFKDAGDSSFAS